MSRILGFVIGAVLVSGGLYYLLTPEGMAPASVELELPVREVDTAVPEAEPEPEPAESAEIELPQPESPRPAPPSEPAEVQLADQAPPAQTGQSPSAMDIADEQVLVEQALSAMQAQQAMQEAMPEAQPGPAAAALPDTEQDGPRPVPEDDTQWFAVWDPFHSELSANAFARRLERMTGLDYRVVRSGPAKYEVAVAFRSEAERVANIALIEEATGLRIAGGDL